MTEDTIFQRVDDRREGLTAKQQKLAAYLVEHYKQAAFMNSTELAKSAGVSGATVIRFADELGYPGFPEMKAALQSIVQQEVNTVDAFNVHTMAASGRRKARESFFQPCIDSMRTVERSLSQTSIDQAADLLYRQESVYVVGFQGSSFLADYMSYYMSKIRKNIFQINSWNNRVFSTVLPENARKDVALIYAFPRFPVMTYKLARYFYDNQIPIVCITALPDNKISKLADVVIHMDIEYVTYIDHMVPALYLSEVLANKVAERDRAAAKMHLEHFEQYAKQNHIFCQREEGV